MAHKYTSEQREFIAGNVSGRTTKELTELVNDRFGLDLTESKMKAYKSNHGLRSGTPCGGSKGRGSSVFPKPVTDYIHANHRGRSHKEMARQLNAEFGTSYTTKQITAFYKNHKLNSGLTGRFQKGDIPANKGQKGIRHSPATEFKKGCTPNNWKPVGTETVRSEGYTWVKIAEPNKWREKHKLVWEAANGPVPKGYVVIFADGDKGNIALENLILVSWAQLVRLNQNNLIGGSAELTRIGIRVADVISKMAERRRQL